MMIARRYRFQAAAANTFALLLALLLANLKLCARLAHWLLRLNYDPEVADTKIAFLSSCR